VRGQHLPCRTSPPSQKPRSVSSGNAWNKRPVLRRLLRLQPQLLDRLLAHDELLESLPHGTFSFPARHSGKTIIAPNSN
jgi:hypothetical protein